MARLWIPNSVGIHNFGALFKNNDYNFSDNHVDIRFHKDYVAMHPIGLAFYAAIGDTIKDRGMTTTAAINYKVKSIPFLQRMGLFEALGYTGPLDLEQHEESGRFIPLRKIRNSKDINDLLCDLDPILHTTRPKANVIKHVFSEMLRNILEHSETKYGGNVCAVYSRDKHKIMIGISDAGIGIYKSMKRHHQIKSDKDAILKALTPGFSGKTKKIGGTSENAGLGLFITKNIAKSTRSHFLIYSGNSYYKLLLTKKGNRIEYYSDPLKDRARIEEKVPLLHGTVIGIDLNIDSTKDFDVLMSMIGEVYRGSIAETKKDYFKRIKFE